MRKRRLGDRADQKNQKYLDGVRENLMVGIERLKEIPGLASEVDKMNLESLIESV
jgi:hypothetical protein